MAKNKVNNFRSCFDIIGPIMIGPSSSHTAGALQIGLLARRLFGNTPTKVTCVYYESFAETHKGHGTDFAIIGGVLGLATNDERVPHSIQLATDLGIEIEFIEKSSASPVNHSNTVDLTLKDDTHTIRLIGISVGGGTVEVKYIKIEDLSIHLQGPLPIILEKLPFNTPSKVLSLLEKHQMLVSHKQIINDDVKNEVLIIYELQSLFSPQFLDELNLLQQNGSLYLLY
ncbi:L-serine dehydratase [Granulicatella balaenopterae]|uniref:L-serine deaminase n=1 Tax=Granulicatella balaenopterae TaxID=137733 RepID=A0A1H9MB67_9LACT|nr:L-serine ammonia-lyase, iron-sulfur-dependent subunit beta [Granulicatella balaenopterae]SER20383.1 L-serine dehydratase [Granulicatella balaenopterae]